VSGLGNGAIVVDQAVTDRLLIDVDADGRVSVSTWLDGELPGEPVGEPTRLVWPLDADGLEELRWYLEDGNAQGRWPTHRSSAAADPRLMSPQLHAQRGQSTVATTQRTWSASHR
jgi:hypothetical protein